MRATEWIVACGLLGLAVGDLQGQSRQCLDLTNDLIVDSADVRVGFRGVAGLNPVIDPRADFDMRAGVNITDIVNQLLVARATRPGLIDLTPRAVSPGQTVQGIVQNLRAGSRVRVTVVTATTTVAAGIATVQDGKLTFQMPQVGDPGELDLPEIELALPGANRQGLVLVRVEQDGRISNPCPILVLRPGEGDRDGDGLRDRVDLCPAHFDPQNGDTDSDGLGDLCDNCPASANRDQADRNNDGSGDACEPGDTVVVNGVAIVPPRGVDPRMREILAAIPHGVLVLTREIDMPIEDTLRAVGVRILRPLVREAFFVAVQPAAFARLGRFRWFRSLIPLDPQIRLVGDLRTVRPEPPDTLLLEVEFHADIELDTARVLLLRRSARILAEGVDLGGRDKLIRRVNIWRIELPSDSLRSLAGLDPVLSIQRAHRNQTMNANSRAAINVNALNLAGLNGNGMTIGEWDGGWAAGDNAIPPPAPAGGANAALTGRVRVRDHGALEGIAAPAGCTVANISCGAGVCVFANHATHVGGTMMGNGTLAGGGAGVNQGMATQAQLISYEWMDGAAEAVCERQDAIANFNTVAHNNSWGYCPMCNNTLGFYDAISSTYDQDIRATPAATEDFAAGNEQNYRNSLFDACNPTVPDPPCALPPIYTAPVCAAPPPGVGAPPALAVPPNNVVNRFYTVSGPGGTAKNIITVGNVDNPNTRLNNSSGMGPTLDGRLKPEVVAHGTSVVSTCVPGVAGCGANGYMTMSGTSMATPAVTGAVALLAERAGILGTPFQADDARALLAHTATDLGVHPGVGGGFLTMAGSQWQNFGAADGPDYLTGYGIVNASAALNHLNSGNISGMLKPSGCPTGVTYPNIPFNSPVAVGGAGPVAGCPAMVWDVVWYVSVPAGTNELRVTVAWNDVAATAGANPTIVNDIDLMLEAPGGVYHYPWWMDPTCPYRQAVRVQANTFDPATYGDHRNNLEQIHLVGGVAAGQWRIIIRTDGLAAGPQPFSMMVSMN